MGTLYDDDIIAWSEQQAALLRAGRWELLDRENIAGEIEDVGHREKKELRSRLIILLAHLLKWQFQPSRRSLCRADSMRTQRVTVDDALEDCPSLQTLLDDPQWFRQVYRRARIDAEAQAHLPDLPDELPWTVEQLLDPDFFPE